MVTAELPQIVSRYGPCDSFLTSSWGFSFSPSFAVGLLFSAELLRAYIPFLFHSLSFLLTLAPIPRFWGDSVDLLDCGLNGKLRKEVSADPIIPEKYKSFHDDRKAKRGDEEDIYMLVTHGFKKYRHLSTNFMKRNNILRYQSSSSSNKKSKKMKETKR